MEWSSNMVLIKLEYAIILENCAVEEQIFKITLDWAYLIAEQYGEPNSENHLFQISGLFYIIF